MYIFFNLNISFCSTVEPSFHKNRVENFSNTKCLFKSLFFKAYPNMYRMNFFHSKLEQSTFLSNKLRYAILMCVF